MQPNSAMAGPEITGEHVHENTGAHVHENMGEHVYSAGMYLEPVGTVLVCGYLSLETPKRLLNSSSDILNSNLNIKEK